MPGIAVMRAGLHAAGLDRPKIRTLHLF